MSNYTKTTNFASKDNLSPGNPLKIVKGTEIDTEFNNIQTAVGTKTDNASANITGGSITGITDLAVADGGTGASTAAGGLNNLLPTQTGNANKYLQTDGTNATWDAVSLSTSDITGTLPVANGGTGVTTSTGTGNVVLSNSPTLVTPALGTPASGTATNLTGLPISTGVSGLGTGVATFLGTPSSANLASAVTDETGSGALVFANSPTLVSPALGTPASGTLTNATGLPISTGVSGLGTGVATFLATPSSANLASAVSDETGSGALVFANSPTLVTPALGTPSALVGTNITGTASGLTAGNVTTNANLTGAITSTGNATSLGSFSSANLLGALTDETGTGSAVFATSPTLVTPILGTPTSATLTNATGLPLTTGVTGQLPVANGGTGTATPSIVAGTNVTVTGTWPNQTIASTAGGSGTVTSVAATVPSVFSISGSPITTSGTLAMTYSGTALPVANGGTGQTSYTDGQLLIGNTTGNTLTKATLTAGTGVSVTNSTGSITIANTSPSQWTTTGSDIYYTTGNVGIGTTAPSDYFASASKFVIANTGGDVGMTLASSTTGAGNIFWADATSGTGEYSGYIQYTHVNDSLVFGTASTERARIDSSGNLGIGTTTVGNKLTVADNSASAMIYAEQSGAGDIIALASGSTERFRITNAGNVLVGTSAVSSQNEKFNVTATNCAAMFKTTGGSTNNWAANFWNNGTTGNNIFVEFGTDTTYTGRGTITYNRAGGLVVYNTTSDYRAKDIYGPVTDSGSLIDSVPVYMGKMKDATQERPMFLAHETPAYAHTGEKDAVDKNGKPVYQQMDASALIPVMWAEIQSLRQRLAAANL